MPFCWLTVYLLDNHQVTIRVSQQERRDRSEQRVLDARQTARAAHDEIWISLVEDVAQRLADATGDDLNLDVYTALLCLVDELSD